jgi:hypothetical protein
MQSTGHPVRAAAQSQLPYCWDGTWVSWRQHGDKGYLLPAIFFLGSCLNHTTLSLPGLVLSQEALGRLG